MIAFSIWSVHVYWYGIMYAISFLMGYGILILGQKKGRYKKYPFVDQLIAKDIDSLLLAVLLGVMIGGRLGYIFIYSLPYFIAHPLKILAYSEGGMSFIGGAIWTIIALWIYCRRAEKPKSWSAFVSQSLLLFDTLMPMIPIAVLFGRFGNFLNQELYGIVIPQDFWWLPSWLVNFCQNTHLFHIYSHIGPELRLNTNFLSMIFEGILLIAIIWYFFLRYWRDKKIAVWQLSAIWLGCYSCVRFFLEYARQDSQAEFLGYFTKSQWFFLLFMMIAVAVIIVQGRKK